jgi:hypothetical protein
VIRKEGPMGVAGAAAGNLACKEEEERLTDGSGQVEMITQKKEGGRWRHHTGDAGTVKTPRSRGSQQPYLLY